MRCLYQSKINKKNKLIPFARTKSTPCEYLIGIYENPEKYTYVESLKVQFVSATMLVKKVQLCKLDIGETEYTFKAMVNAYFNELSLIPNYNFTDSKPNYNSKSKIEFYLSCIPNTEEKPQTYEMWYSIGQALKNIEDEYPHLNMLLLWTQWSLGASQKYPNEIHNCRKAWDNLKVKEGPKYKTLFIKRMATIFNLDALHIYNTSNLCGDLFHLNLSGFSKVDVYNKNLEQLDTEKGYCKPFDFGTSKTCLDATPMGFGKTYQIFEHLKNNPYKRILLVSPRKTFSKEKVAELQHIYPDFMDYTDDRMKTYINWSEVDKLACQVESLHKIEHTEFDEPYNFTMLDEIESILYQFSSTTNSMNSMKNFNTFLNAIKYSDKIIAADAFITNRTLTFMKQLGISTNVSINQYRKKDRTAVILGNAKNCHELIKVKQDFASHLIDSLKKGKKICAVIGSQKFAVVIVDTIVNEFGPEYINKIKLYDSKIADENINDLKNVNEIWGNENISLVIYTTKITIGVSYTKEDFDLVYIYGTSISSVPRDIIQAHFRVRNIKENTVYISMFSGTPRDIHSSIHEEAKKNKYLDETFSRDIQCWSDPSYEALYTTMRNYNSMEDHVSTWNYEKVLMYYLNDIGYKIEYHQEASINKVELVKNMINIDAYHKYKNTNKQIIEDIEKRVKGGKASCEDKLIIEAYYFYHRIVKKTLLDKLNYSFTEVYSDITKTEFEKESFNAYLSDKMFNIQLNNMINEIGIIYYDKRYNVINDQKNAMKHSFIRKITSILNIHYSFCTEALISSENMLKVLEYYKKLSNEEKEIFSEVFKIPKLNLKSEFHNAKKLIATCINDWNGMNLKTSDQKRDQKNGVHTRTYTYTIESKHELMAIWRNIMTPNYCLDDITPIPKIKKYAIL